MKTEIASFNEKYIKNKLNISDNVFKGKKKPIEAIKVKNISIVDKKLSGKVKTGKSEMLFSTIQKIGFKIISIIIFIRYYAKLLLIF